MCRGRHSKQSMDCDFCPHPVQPLAFKGPTYSRVWSEQLLLLLTFVMPIMPQPVVVMNQCVEERRASFLPGWNLLLRNFFRWPLRHSGRGRQNSIPPLTLSPGCVSLYIYLPTVIFSLKHSPNPIIYSCHILNHLFWTYCHFLCSEWFTFASRVKEL